MQRYHYQSSAELIEPLKALLLAYNRTKYLKTLREFTPHEFIRAQRQKNPAVLICVPTYLTLEVYT